MRTNAAGPRPTTDVSFARADQTIGQSHPKLPTLDASPSHDPYAMAQLTVRIGNDILNGKNPEKPIPLMPSNLVTRENVGQHKGWPLPR